MSHHRCRTIPVQPVIPHLVMVRQATGSVRCASSQHTLSAVRTRIPFFWVIEIGPQWNTGSCGNYRCVHHTSGRIQFAALAIHAANVRTHRNIPTSATLLTDLRRRGASTAFRLQRHRLGEPIHMAVSALDILTDRWENRLAASRIDCVRVVLSFLASELGGDFGRTWPRDTRSSVPETELPVGAVNVENFAFQTLVVTNKQVALLSQFVHQLPNGRPCARFLRCHQGFEFIDVACCSTFCPDVCLYQRQTFGHTDSDAFSLFGFCVPGSSQAAIVLPPPQPPRLPQTQQACGGSWSCFA